MYKREVLLIAYYVHHFKSKLTLKNTANNSIKENTASKSILRNPFKWLSYFFLPILSRYNTAKRADWENPFIYAYSSLQPLPNTVEKSTRGNIAKNTMPIGSQKLWVQEKKIRILFSFLWRFQFALRPSQPVVLSAIDFLHFWKLLIQSLYWYAEN